MSYLKFCTIVLLTIISSSSSFVFSQTQRKVSIEGHRGAKGHLPENTIPSFLLAIDLGADTLEMDVVITKDKRVLVSHEPWFHHMISLDPSGERITAEKEREHNIYRMTYAETTRYDVGSLGHPLFLTQKPIKAQKPLLTDVFKAVDEHIQDRGLAPVRFNIEIKSTPQGDKTFHPEPAEFARHVLDDVKRSGMEERVIIQSFDVRPLQELRKMVPDLPLALLVAGSEDPTAKLDRLGFIPDTLSPNFNLVSDKLVRLCRDRGMRLVPWTVNEIADLKRMANFDIDGIITDFPDRAVTVFRK